MAHRIQDLKRDGRFKYISVFKNHGASAGQEFEHPNFSADSDYICSPSCALRIARLARLLSTKERCVFCDIINQETHKICGCSNHVEMSLRFVRTPRAFHMKPGSFHDDEAAFERFGLTRPRLPISAPYCAVLSSESAPSPRHSISSCTRLLICSIRSATMGYWKTIDEDYHWHIEILPIFRRRQNPTPSKKFIFLLSAQRLQ